jgi:glycerate kinase
MAAGIRAAAGRVRIISLPVSDGGTGCLEAILYAQGGKKIPVQVHDPLMRPITAEIGIPGSGGCAVIEMASASGLTLLEPGERDPTRTTSYGTGELIKAALDHNVCKIIVGIGGSATTDGGVGAAQALGCRFLDEKGAPLKKGLPGGDLKKIHGFDLAGRDERVSERELIVAWDVDNPFTGPSGAARVYSPQKGATPEQAEELEQGLCSLELLVKKHLGIDLFVVPGAGAAGGLGGGMTAFLGAKMMRGIDVVIEAVGFREKLKGADLVLTGEGSLDYQTLHGKTISGIIREAKKAGVPVIALAGTLGTNIESLYEHGLTAAFSINPEGIPLDTAMREVLKNLHTTTENLVRKLLDAP